MAGLDHFFWLAVFVVVGIPVALGIELYFRGRPTKPSEPSHLDQDFLNLPADSGIARHITRASESSDF